MSAGRGTVEPRSGIITLTTDFGTRDAYVGAMKGVIYRILPSAHVVDITHEIPPQKILDAALLIEGAYPWFPPGTVHVVVVDPGVGTPRRPIAVHSGGQLFVAPDNGVLSSPLARRDAIAHEITEIGFELPNRSDTFHGRDIFSPTAAHLASGVELERLGSQVDDVVRLEVPHPVVSAGEIRGEILRVDRFGNTLSNIPRSLLREIGSGPYEVLVSDRSFGTLRRRYEDVPQGDSLALTGGDGRVEISVNSGSAAEELGIRPGDVMVIRPLPAEAGSG
ncbi:MAG: hypothetical protein GF330_00540 [Candidatus Eisenbacteria bacterium]|nr:hypothetical protein [Candidatus Eisenbacteria bacterium]